MSLKARCPRYNQTHLLNEAQAGKQVRYPNRHPLAMAAGPARLSLVLAVAGSALLLVVFASGAGAQKPKGKEILIPPLDFNNIAKSDKLTIRVPPAKKGDPPPPNVWDGHTNHIRGLAFTDDGRFVTLVDLVDDGNRAVITFRLLDLQTGGNLALASGENVRGGPMTPDGRFVAYHNVTPGGPVVEIYDRLEPMVDLGVPNVALAEYRAPENYPVADCPLCKSGMPITAF